MGHCGYNAVWSFFCSKKQTMLFVREVKKGLLCRMMPIMIVQVMDSSSLLMIDSSNSYFQSIPGLLQFHLYLF